MVEFTGCAEHASEPSDTELPEPRSRFSGDELWQPVTDELAQRLAAMHDTPKWAKKRRLFKGALKLPTQRARRASVPLRAYIGPNGSGKSATAVFDLLDSLRGAIWECSEPGHGHTMRGITRGYRLIYSTVLITEPGTDGRPHPLYRRLDSWEPFLKAEHADFFLDEITGIANARNYGALPIQVATTMDQQRKTQNTVSWTAPSYARADSTLRDITQLVTDCRSYWKRREPGVLSAWAPRRLIRCRSFAATDRSEFDKGDTSQHKQKQFRLKASIVQWWFGPGSEVYQSYSSTGAVSRIGAVSDGGVCAYCGGTRTRSRCTCDQ